MNTYGYTKNKEQIVKRLNRVEGQVRGVTRMVVEDKYCVDILTQINAAQAALDKVALELLGEHARHCLANDNIGPKGTEAKAEELVTAVSRMLSR
ncbi:metal-sensitive transcriptional regulator [Candidatus Saccharibacteria bacterium]|nr:metal-sensitive transcriptional regulator [Candidatus Saccharibacteria bacterium]